MVFIKFCRMFYLAGNAHVTKILRNERSLKKRKKAGFTCHLHAKVTPRIGWRRAPESPPPTLRLPRRPSLPHKARQYPSLFARLCHSLLRSHFPSIDELLHVVNSDRYSSHGRKILV
jgi:hypothetical protein